MTSSWTARYPDLTGKAVIVAGDSRQINGVVRGLAANGGLLAIVSADRDVVDEAVLTAEALDAPVVGMTADPGSASVWERVGPHIEQRLGPIDVVVAIGGSELRAAISAAVLPDMAARHRGVLIEIDTAVAAMTTSPGVHHRRIETGPGGGDDGDLAAIVLLCASDGVSAASLTITVA